jgi:hypothetical protein
MTREKNVPRPRAIQQCLDMGTLLLDVHTEVATIFQANYEYQIKNLYGRLRDTYERVVEEIVLRDTSMELLPLKRRRRK